jgi:hypothetical protein
MTVDAMLLGLHFLLLSRLKIPRELKMYLEVSNILSKSKFMSYLWLNKKQIIRLIRKFSFVKLTFMVG